MDISLKMPKLILHFYLCIDILYLIFKNILNILECNIKWGFIGPKYLKPAKIITTPEKIIIELKILSINFTFFTLSLLLNLPDRKSVV